MLMLGLRPAAPIVVSYYQFLRQGRAGYTLCAHNQQQVIYDVAAVKPRLVPVSGC